MKSLTLLLLFTLTIILNFEVLSQNNSDNTSNSENHEFTEKQWNKIEKRWDKRQANIILITKAGDTLKGQFVYINDSEIALYPERDIILSSKQAQLITHHLLTDVEYIFLEKRKDFIPIWTYTLVAGAAAGTAVGLIVSQGWSVAVVIAGTTLGAGLGTWVGFKIQKAKAPKKIAINSDNYDDKENLLKLRKKAIYTDSIEFPLSIYQAVDNSRVMNRVFSKKHLRVSVAMSAGPNFIGKITNNALESAGIISPKLDYYPVSYELPDISWRFSDKFIVGGQLYFGQHSTYRDYTDYSNPNSNPTNLYYSYDISEFEMRLYLEYALKPVDRFMTKPYEFLIGGGIIMGNRTFDFTSYDSFYDNFYSYNKEVIYGLQARSSFHYYPIKSISIFTGIEANLYTNAIVPEMKFSTFDPVKEYIIPEQKLNFSTIRVNFGVSLHL